MYTPSQYLEDSVEGGDVEQHNTAPARYYEGSSYEPLVDTPFNTFMNQPAAVVPWKGSDIVDKSPFTLQELRGLPPSGMQDSFISSHESSSTRTTESPGDMMSIQSPSQTPLSTRWPSRISSSSAATTTYPEAKTRKKMPGSKSDTAKPAPASKRRKAKKETATISVDEEPEEDENKRNKFLERNRVAASKCRQKKKVWVSDLEETKHGLQSQNTQLHSEYSGLVSEINTMKTQLMNHATCRDPMIDKWIENEARRYVQNTSDRFDRMGVHLPHGHAYCADGSHSQPSSAAEESPMDDAAFPYSRRGSMAFSLASPTLFQRYPGTSLGGGGPDGASPDIDLERDEKYLVDKDDVNFEHMPDTLFEAA